MCRTKSVWPSKKVWGCVSSHRLLVYHLPISQRFLPEHASDIWWYLFARGADHCHTRTRDQIILRKRGLRLSAAVNFSTRDLWLPVCMAYIWPFRWPKSRQKSACWVLVSWYLLFFFANLLDGWYWLVLIKHPSGRIFLGIDIGVPGFQKADIGYSFVMFCYSWNWGFLPWLLQLLWFILDYIYWCCRCWLLTWAKIPTVETF